MCFCTQSALFCPRLDPRTNQPFLILHFPFHCFCRSRVGCRSCHFHGVCEANSWPGTGVERVIQGLQVLVVPCVFVTHHHHLIPFTTFTLTHTLSFIHTCTYMYTSTHTLLASTWSVGVVPCWSCPSTEQTSGPSHGVGICPAGRVSHPVPGQKWVYKFWEQLDVLSLNWVAAGFYTCSLSQHVHQAD